MSVRRAEKARSAVPEPPQPGRVLDARLHLLDRQVLDVDGVPVCTLDDLELDDVAAEPATRAAGGGTAVGDGPVVIRALLSGPVLGTRMFGGRPPGSRWHRLPWRDVTDIGTAVRLGVPGARLDVTWLERWARNHVVGRIPGGRARPGKG
ncbi:hypothetical protein [Myceligenerans salitolerans]|uniref:Uncharacterized protein n=1 Tax=Myceligenerans salitolerans TaxID=1230528 RepID=A0ABS3I8T3_9MICO|nr:hypothetical protein [Myceligenerans salitolerans]MBO0609001.1 hypothetical protein [Myceligenerans salitolerans]